MNDWRERVSDAIESFSGAPKESFVAIETVAGAPTPRKDSPITLSTIDGTYVYASSA